MSFFASVVLRDPDDPTRLAEFDNLFKTLLTIDAPHHEVHEGCAFLTDAVDTSMGDTDTLILAFKTMSGTKRAHMIVEFATLVGAHVDVTEGPTWTTNTGAANPIYNRKREASMTSSGFLEDLTATPTFTATDNVLLNPTGLAGGTVIHDIYGFGVKNQATAAGRDVAEWILKPDTQYAVVLTADGNSNAAQLILNWYEHQDE